MIDLGLTLLSRHCLGVISWQNSQGYLGFSMVTPPRQQRFPFGRNNLKNILVRPFKFGLFIYMGNVTNTIVLFCFVLWS